jgi:hypothetical protein
MATFNKFQSFIEYAVEGANLGTDQFTVALCAAANAPVATNSVLADLTQISYTNCSARNITTSSSAQTTGTYKLTLADLTLTASGGDVAAFRYVVVYDDTVANKPLVAWYDYGAAVTITNGNSFLIDFDGSNGFLTIA